MHIRKAKQNETPEEREKRLKALGGIGERIRNLDISGFDYRTDSTGAVILTRGADEYEEDLIRERQDRENYSSPSSLGRRAV